jgi:hypothetical protein
MMKGKKNMEVLVDSLSDKELEKLMRKLSTDELKELIAHMERYNTKVKRNLKTKMWSMQEQKKLCLSLLKKTWLTVPDEMRTYLAKYYSQLSEICK